MKLSNYSVESMSIEELNTINGGGAWATLLGNVVGVVLNGWPPSAAVINVYECF